MAKSAVEADGELAAALARRAREHPALVLGQRHGLLDEHVLAGGKRGDGLRRVLVMAAQDDDGVDAGIADHRLVVGGAVLGAESPRITLAAGAARRDDRAQRDTRHRSQRRK